MTKLPILFKEKWFYPTYFDNAHRIWDKKETGDWSGNLLVKNFTARQKKRGIALSIEIEVLSFGGETEEEMQKDLIQKIEGMKELPVEADGNKDFIPEEIKNKLKLYEQTRTN